MKTKHNKFLPRMHLGASLLCLAMLGGVYAERSRRLTPVDVEPYHARAKEAVDSIRYTLGFWTGSDVKVPEAAQKLLRPNAMLSRIYIDNDPSVRMPLRASLLVVQCRDPRDMQGHYPPNCYPAAGQTLAAATPVAITIPATSAAPATPINGTEYVFTADRNGQRYTTVVFNTLLIPGVGSTADMKGVYKASEDYQRRLYGAAQIHIVLTDEMSAEQRLEIYEKFLTACSAPVHAFLDAGTAPSTAVADASVSARPK